MWLSIHTRIHFYMKIAVIAVHVAYDAIKRSPVVGESTASSQSSLHAKTSRMFDLSREMDG